MDIAKAVAQRIEQYRVEKGWTLYRLAVNSKIPHSTLSNLMHCNSKACTLSTLKKICGALNVSLGEFFTDELFDKK